MEGELGYLLWNLLAYIVSGSIMAYLYYKLAKREEAAIPQLVGEHLWVTMPGSAIRRMKTSYGIGLSGRVSLNDD
jgi:hypothetical protein